MKVSTSQMIPMIAMLTVLVVGFQNCGQTRFTQVDEAMSLKAVDESGNLVPAGDSSELIGAEVPAAPVAANDDSGFVTSAPEMQPPVAQQPQAPVVSQPPVVTEQPAPVAAPVASPTPKAMDPGVVPPGRDVASEDDDKAADKDDGRGGPCAALKSVAMPLEIDAAAPDLTSRNAHGPLEIDFAKNLIVSNHNGPLLVKSAAIANITSVKGQVRVAANLVNGSNLGGNVCILADKVGSISNIGGGSHIVAREVDSITNSNGNVHIFGARVQKIANHKGKICLHDGAVVLDVVNAQVGKCD